MAYENLQNKKILITGSEGFLGTHLVEQLKKIPCELITPKIKDFDLRKEEKVFELFEKTKPNIVIHLAADLGGIGYIKENSGSIFYNNLMMNSLLLEYSKKYNVEKFVGIGTAFSYSNNLEIPFKEEDIWKGEIEEVNSPYILPKKILLSQSQAYKKQFGLNAIHLILTSFYGPGMGESHAIPSLIKRIKESKENNNDLVVWGTGNASRDQLYVKDAIEAILRATSNYNSSKPINIGSGKETRVKELVETLTTLLNFNGKIIWDETKPEGPKRIFLDTAKAESELGFKAITTLREGLEKTIKYFS